MRCAPNISIPAGYYRMNRRLVCLSVLFVTMVLFKARAQDTTAFALSDTNATIQAKKLYFNMRQLSKRGVMFGHQDDLAYGARWRYVPGASDVKALTGDYPAVYGWDLGHLELGGNKNLDGVPFEKMKAFIRQSYDRGGVVTISWHNRNPLSGGTSWDTLAGTVASILPGGKKHAIYTQWLSQMADFMLSLKGKEGELIPVLFRPYHELTGSWFWWGRNLCTADEYKALWRFTVQYLRKKKAHNLLYVYNTGEFSSREEFLERYPGDDVVDLISVDAYQFDKPETGKFTAAMRSRFAILQEIAADKNKLFAFAETGYEATPYKKWWTDVLWKSLSGYHVSYVLLWRNHGYMEHTQTNHYYVPVSGDVSAPDFVDFYKHDSTFFQREAAAARLYE